MHEIPDLTELKKEIESLLGTNAEVPESSKQEESEGAFVKDPTPRLTQEPFLVLEASLHNIGRAIAIKNFWAFIEYGAVAELETP